MSRPPTVMTLEEIRACERELQARVDVRTYAGERPPLENTPWADRSVNQMLADIGQSVLWYIRHRQTGFLV